MADTKLLTIPHLDRTQLARIFSKIRVNPDTGCWEWTAALNYAGYGKTNWKSEEMSSHRLLYAWLVGPLPYGRGRMTLDHFACDNRRCCFPAHLKLVTTGENVLRGLGPCAVNRRKTHCKRGHPLPEAPNAHNGKARVCQECARLAGHQNYLKNKEAVIRRTAAAQRVRMNGERREEFLARKRAHYHATKTLKRPKHTQPSVPLNAAPNPSANQASDRRTTE